jgi:regulator of protease activity HflC (stomatin/prohibitin superfamily)
MHVDSVVTNYVGWIIGAIVLALLIFPSIRSIGQTEVGLVHKRFSRKKLSEGNPIAFHGEAGYQSELLMPGFRFKFWILYGVRKFPWVQVPAGEIGVVISQIGQGLPTGAKSAIYKPEFGIYSDVRTFVDGGGQKGVQRSVLPPGTLAPIHPIAFLVITKSRIHGMPVDPNILSILNREEGGLSIKAFGIHPEQLEVVRIEPKPYGESGALSDMVGVVTTYEGPPLESGDIACRLGGFEDLASMEITKKTDAEIIEYILNSKNNMHNSFQDYQKFLDSGGKIGLQHDVLLYGAYNLNPFLVKVELVPMLIVQQGQVAVIKSYVGLATQDTSGATFKFGSLVRPGHRGVWQEPLRTGKYAINPRIYNAEIVPTSILTLNWADATSKAHNLDRELKQIIAKSREGFVFNIDLQVQIHIPDTLAPRVISMVGTMQNLANEVLQAAVGNHFRDKLQSMPAVMFIETRQEVQNKALELITDKLSVYQVETKGVYIQDVVFPAELVKVLTSREIANQEIETYKKEKSAEDERIEMEKARGTANMQKELSASKVGVDIQKNNAEARKAQADGEATYLEKVGLAKGAEPRSVGLANAEAYAKQVQALGMQGTMWVNIANALSKGQQPFMPNILVAGGGNSLDGLAAALTGKFAPTPSTPPVETTPTA